MTSARIAAASNRPMISYLVLGYVALLPYQLQIGDHLNFAVADCFLLGVLLLAPAGIQYRKATWNVWHLAVVLTLLYGAMIAVLRSGTIERYEIFNKCAGLLLPLLSYAAITSAVRDWHDMRQILRMFAIGVIVENLVAVGAFLAAYFFGVSNPFARYGGLRLSGTLLDPNAYGGLLVAAFVVCEGASCGSVRFFPRPMLWVSRLSLGLGILFTFSRSAWIALACALVILCVVCTRAAIRLLGFAALGAPALVLLMGQRFGPIFEEMASRPKQVEGRFELIRSALQAFGEHPLLGGGLGRFRLGVGEIAHNTAMWFLADFGIVGLSVFLAFTGWFFVKGWQAYGLAPLEEKPLVIALLLAHAAMFGLSMGIEAFYQRPWWMVLALIASSHALVVRRRSVHNLSRLAPC